MTEHKIVIDGRFASMNEFIDANRAHRQQGNSMKKRDQKIISVYIKNQLRGVRITNQVYIKYKFYEPNARRDLDNISGYFHKVFQDALVFCGVIVDDNWNYVVGFSDDFYVSKNNPRIEITLQERARK